MIHGLRHFFWYLHAVCYFLPRNKTRTQYFDPIPEPAFTLYTAPTRCSPAALFLTPALARHSDRDQCLLVLDEQLSFCVSILSKPQSQRRQYSEKPKAKIDCGCMLFQPALPEEIDWYAWRGGGGLRASLVPCAPGKPLIRSVRLPIPPN